MQEPSGSLRALIEGEGHLDGSMSGFSWLQTGDEAFRQMIDAIEASKKSVDLECYIFTPSPLTERVLAALCRAARRGLVVRCLIDAFGSFQLADSVLAPLSEAGGEYRWFNPLSLKRFSFRNHRKLLVCDRQLAVIGGFNLSPEWEGDGIKRGWRDLGAVIRGSLAGELADSFEAMYAKASFRHRRFMRLRRFHAKRRVESDTGDLLLTGPGWGPSPVLKTLRQDLRSARVVRIIAAYFVPPRFLVRRLARLARRGGTVELILPGPTDIPIAKLAAQSLYGRLLPSGVRVYEYQPQILHAKLMLLDDILYLGSSNLDRRSLHINYELVVRMKNAQQAKEANDLFTDYLRHCRQVKPVEWRQSRTIWRRWKERWAHWFLARFDPFIVRQQLRWMR